MSGKVNWRQVIYTGIVVAFGTFAIMSLPEPYESAVATGGATMLGLWAWQRTGKH